MNYLNPWMQISIQMRLFNLQAEGAEKYNSPMRMTDSNNYL